MRNTLCHPGLKREVEAPVTPPSCPPPSSPRSAPAISASAVPDVFLLVTALRDKAKLLELLLWAGGQIQKSELGVWLAQLMWPHTLSFPRLRRGKRGRRGLDVQFCYGKGSMMCWPFNKEGVLYLGSLKLVVCMWPLSPGCSLAGKMVTKSQNHKICGAVGSLSVTFWQGQDCAGFCTRGTPVRGGPGCPKPAYSVQGSPENSSDIARVLSRRRRGWWKT